MVTLACVLDDPLRVGVKAAVLRSIAAEHGAIATWERFAIRAGRPLEWMEGRLRGIASMPDELTLIVVHVGYATMTRPASEADRQAAREVLAGCVLRLYLEELDAFEAAVAAAKAELPAHLRDDDDRQDEAPPAPAAPVAPLPAGGLRDLFTGEARLPVYSDDPPAARSPQRRLL